MFEISSGENVQTVWYDAGRIPTTIYHTEVLWEQLLCKCLFILKFLGD